MEIVALSLKHCNKCHVEKPVSDFNKDSRSADGKQHKCRDCQRIMKREWQKENSGYAVEYVAAYQKSHPEKSKQWKREIYQRRKHKISANHLSLKLEIMMAYGGCKCACCGETNHIFLTIDHMDGNGSKHRTEIFGKSRSSGGALFYRWLKNNNFPSGFQVLCYNCNIGKHRNGNVCPHKTKEKE